MSKKSVPLFTLAIAAALISAPAAQAVGKMDEVQSIQRVIAGESGRAAYAPGRGVAFKASDNVFLKSALAIGFTFRENACHYCMAGPRRWPGCRSSTRP